MAANALVQARVDSNIKKEAAAVLAKAGLTVSDAVRLMLIKTAQEKTLPFEMWKPNAETLAAMQEADHMLEDRSARFATGNDLLNDLGQKAAE